MKPTGLKVGDKVVVTAFGMDKPCTIVKVTMSEEVYGYVIISLKEASQIIRVHYEKNLDYWGSVPILL